MTSNTMEQLHATSSTSCGLNNAEQPVEKRIAHDGVPYTYHEFQRKYGLHADVYWFTIRRSTRTVSQPAHTAPTNSTQRPQHILAEQMQASRNPEHGSLDCDDDNSTPDLSSEDEVPLQWAWYIA